MLDCRYWLVTRSNTSRYFDSCREFQDPLIAPSAVKSPIRLPKSPADTQDSSPTASKSPHTIHSRCVLVCKNNCKNKGYGIMELQKFVVKTSSLTFWMKGFSAACPPFWCASFSFVFSLRNECNGEKGETNLIKNVNVYISHSRRRSLFYDFWRLLKKLGNPPSFNVVYLIRRKH